MPTRSLRFRALAGAALVLTLALAPAASASTSLVTTLGNATVNERHRLGVFDAPATAIADFNGDGRAEIVGHNENRFVYVMASDRPHVYAEFTTPHPPGWGARALNDPAVGDVDGNGQLDIVIVNSAAFTCRFEYEPAKSTASSWHFAERWCHRADWFFGNPGADAGAQLFDVTGDGKLEAFMQGEERGLFAYRHDGSVLWARNEWGGNGGALLADLENDGGVEAVFFSDGGKVRAFDARTGHEKWFFDAGAHVWPASIPVAGSAGDVDNDGRAEIVFTARDAEDAGNHKNNHVMIFALEHDGRLKWRVQPAWANPLSYTHPVLHDVTGDGAADVILQDWNTMGHKPGNWERLGPANVFALNGRNGHELWRTTIDNSWSNDDVALADADGDGQLEVLAVGPGPGGDGVWYLDAATGAKETHVSAHGWTVMRGPTAGDFDDSGDLDWVVSARKDGGGYLVFDTSAACRVAYGGFQNPSPCDPSAGRGGAGGGSGSTPAPGTFSATFRTTGGNAWWVEVFVNAEGASLTSVDARKNGGAWVPLEHKSWGAWAKSFHVPDGSVVEFRARATTGAHASSDAYRWPDGAKTTAPRSGGGGAPGGGAFAPIFRTPGGNAWWVEVFVDANKPVTDVYARVSNGAWVPLERESWGAWTASFHVPDGSHVQFRARASSSEQAVSGAFRWPNGDAVSGGRDGDAGAFTASFRNVRGNDWWVEAEVHASRTVIGVDARVNGGAWVPLDKKDWGSWARSVHAPAGSTVQFRATDAGGHHATSSTFEWPRG